MTRTAGAIAALVDKLRAALSVEFRVLRAERSLIVLLPLALQPCPLPALDLRKFTYDSLAKALLDSARWCVPRAGACTL